VKSGGMQSLIFSGPHDLISQDHRFESHEAYVVSILSLDSTAVIPRISHSSVALYISTDCFDATGSTIRKSLSMVRNVKKCGNLTT
jgi:hypothetical protein